MRAGNIEIQTAQRRMMRIIVKMGGKPGKRFAAAHDANVDEIADGEAHDFDSDPKHDTTEANPQDLKREESSHDADSTPSFDDVPNDAPVHELEP